MASEVEGFPASLATRCNAPLAAFVFCKSFFLAVRQIQSRRCHTTTAARVHHGALFLPPRKPIAFGHDHCLGLRRRCESCHLTPRHQLFYMSFCLMPAPIKGASFRCSTSITFKHELVRIGFYASFSLERSQLSALLIDLRCIPLTVATAQR
jgi:hypothetical protein